MRNSKKAPTWGSFWSEVFCRMGKSDISDLIMRTGGFDSVPAWEPEGIGGMILDYLIVKDPEKVIDIPEGTVCYASVFDIAAEFGGCEGIYGDIFLTLRDESFNVLGKSRMEMATFKTLGETVNDFRDMHALLGLVKYFANEVFYELCNGRDWQKSSKEMEVES